MSFMLALCEIIFYNVVFNQLFSTVFAVFLLKWTEGISFFLGWFSIFSGWFSCSSERWRWWQSWLLCRPPAHTPPAHAQCPTSDTRKQVFLTPKDQEFINWITVNDWPCILRREPEPPAHRSNWSKQSQPLAEQTVIQRIYCMLNTGRKPSPPFLYV